MTVSFPLTRATLRTLEGPSRKGGSKDERKQPPRKGDAAK